MYGDRCCRLLRTVAGLGKKYVRGLNDCRLLVLEGCRLLGNYVGKRRGNVFGLHLTCLGLCEAIVFLVSHPSAGCRCEIVGFRKERGVQPGGEKEGSTDSHTAQPTSWRDVRDGKAPL